MVSIEDGVRLVKAAREIIEAETEGRSVSPELPGFMAGTNSGVFITLNEHPRGILRGCIGYPEPPFSQERAFLISSRGVCYDQRFPPLKTTQAKKCTVEVTLLTVPEVIEYDSVQELMSKIEVGKDGLIVTFVRNMGLVSTAVYLPQVAAEEGWGIKEYLSNLCMKAGLQEDAWHSCALEFKKFQGEVFGETSPGGEIVRK